jgi:hypothetical protein
MALAARAGQVEPQVRLLLEPLARVAAAQESAASPQAVQRAAALQTAARPRAVLQAAEQLA